MGGTGEIHITGVRICDSCKGDDKEVFPYGVEDATGKYWEHLCDECFDSLGCRYPNTEQSDEGHRIEPYYEHEFWFYDDGDYEADCCWHCGKEFEDFSDLGCEYCDSRHPGFGVAAQREGEA